MVASADGQAFREPLRGHRRTGVPVQVLGFREHAAGRSRRRSSEFVDLEDIPGVFREPLPRVSLDSLPDEGAWLQPFRPLRLLSGARTDILAVPTRSRTINRRELSTTMTCLSTERSCGVWCHRQLVYRLRFTVIGVMVALMARASARTASASNKHLSQSGWDDPGSESVARGPAGRRAPRTRPHSRTSSLLYTAPEGKTVDDPAFGAKVDVVETSTASPARSSTAPIPARRSSRSWNDFDKATRTRSGRRLVDRSQATRVRQHRDQGRQRHRVDRNNFKIRRTVLRHRRRSTSTVNGRPATRRRRASTTPWPRHPPDGDPAPCRWWRPAVLHLRRRRRRGAAR